MQKNIRITSGTLKNLHLKVSQDTRATAEIVKLAIFSMIGDNICDKTCADIFAGSGNLGLEALSRGAKHVTFIDNSKYAIDSINLNIESSKQRQILTDQNAIEIIKKDALDFISNSTIHYDIIFLDPPYDSPNKYLLKQITNLMHNKTLTFYLHQKSAKVDYLNINQNLKLIDTRSYGITAVDLLTLI